MARTLRRRPDLANLSGRPLNSKSGRFPGPYLTTAVLRYEDTDDGGSAVIQPSSTRLDSHTCFQTSGRCTARVPQHDGASRAGRSDGVSLAISAKQNPASVSRPASFDKTPAGLPGRVWDRAVGGARHETPRTLDHRSVIGGCVLPRRIRRDESAVGLLCAETLAEAAPADGSPTNRLTPAAAAGDHSCDGPLGRTTELRAGRLNPCMPDHSPHAEPGTRNHGAALTHSKKPRCAA